MTPQHDKPSASDLRRQVTVGSAPRRAILAAILATAGCDQVAKLTDTGAGGGVAVPTEVQRVFDQRCATAGCHDAATAAASLDLTAPNSNNIIGGMTPASPLPMVALGNIEGSYLAAKILPAAPVGVSILGTRMPLSVDFNDPDLAVDLAVILGWIGGASLPGGVVDGGSDDVAEGGDGGSGLVGCSIFELAANVDSPVQGGTSAGVIPLQIAGALEQNCGCHYATAAQLGAAGGFAYSGPVGMSTFAQFQEIYSGTNPLYDGLANWEVVRARVGNDTMPLSYCVVEGGNPISGDDKMLLLQWLGDGAPDAPTWDGMGTTGGG